MGLATSLNAIADVIDPSLAYWEVLLSTGKRWSERSMVGTLKHGQAGVRKIDWAHELVATGDIHKIRELILHCPNGQNAVLEIMSFGDMVSQYPAFQFKTRSFNPMKAGSIQWEYQVIGRVVNRATGACECFIWDYHPKPGEPHLVAYKSTIYDFGLWRDTMTPIGSLSHEVQGFRL